MHGLDTPLTSASEAWPNDRPAEVARTVGAWSAPGDRKWTWVPIRSLGPRHRPKIAAHLLSLSVSDRFLRFGHPATDAQISKYVDLLEFERDEIFGIFNRRLDLVAVGHLAQLVEVQAGPACEFGVSVLARSRGRGFGHRLSEHAMLLARNRGVRRLIIHALSENIAMLKIARDLGAKVERHGAEAEAWLELPPDTIASRAGEVVEQHAAEIDYRLKLHAWNSSPGEPLEPPIDSRIDDR
jgi:GNAT superfamily N-acetyltransferase